MTGRVEVTRDDECLLRALASLVQFLPEAKRASHLRPKCVNLADRIRSALPTEDACTA